MRSILLALALCLSACSGAPEPTPESPSPPAPVACSTDADCVMCTGAGCSCLLASATTGCPESLQTCVAWPCTQKTARCQEGTCTLQDAPPPAAPSD